VETSLCAERAKGRKKVRGLSYTSTKKMCFPHCFGSEKIKLKIQNFFFLLPLGLPNIKKFIHCLFLHAPLPHFKSSKEMLISTKQKFEKKKKEKKEF